MLTRRAFAMHFSITKSFRYFVSRDPADCRSRCFAFESPKHGQTSKSAPGDNSSFFSGLKISESDCVRPRPVQLMSNCFAAAPKISCLQISFLTWGASVMKRTRRQPIVIACRKMTTFCRQPNSSTKEKEDIQLRKRNLSLCFFLVMPKLSPRDLMISVIDGFCERRDRRSKNRSHAATQKKEGEDEH